MKTSRRLLPVLVVLAFLPTGSACRPSGAVETEAAAREVRDLITALTPPPLTSIPVVKSEFHVNRKRTLERMRTASEAHGLVALQIFREDESALPEVRAGLLDVAAHTAPAACEALLVELVTTFGEDLLIRREAAELLGTCVPERALEVLEPILRGGRDDRTYPPEDQMLGAWVQACETLGRDPVPLLALVATDLQRMQDVRHMATKALGRHGSPLSRQALETLLVESSGNGYIRRLALQSLLQSIPKNDFCALARTVQSRESDPDFIVFLQSAMDGNCR